MVKGFWNGGCVSDAPVSVEKDGPPTVGSYPLHYLVHLGNIPEALVDLVHDLGGELEMEFVPAVFERVGFVVAVAVFAIGLGRASFVAHASAAGFFLGCRQVPVVPGGRRRRGMGIVAIFVAIAVAVTTITVATGSTRGRTASVGGNGSHFGNIGFAGSSARWNTRHIGVVAVVVAAGR